MMMIMSPLPRIQKIELNVVRHDNQNIISIILIFAAHTFYPFLGVAVEYRYSII